MFTVVIPTMWKFKPFTNFLNTLLNYDLVGEVILVDNDSDNSDKEFDDNNNILFHKKLTYYNFDRNIGVNPVWNLGVEKAKYNDICILNDDVIFDLTLFNKVEPFLQDKNTGVIGLCPGEKDFNQPPFINGSIDITPWNGEHSYGFGCLMFINKKNYIKIPSELVIYYGDNFIFDSNLANLKTNYVISNINHYTPFAVTTSQVGSGYLDREHPLYLDIIKNEKWGLNILNFEYQKALDTESDIQELLPILHDLAYEVDSVLELGVRMGLSTRAFLSANLKKLTSLDIEEDFFVRDLFKVADILNRDYSYLIENTLTYVNTDEYDLLFIDTDHTFEQLTQELKRYKRYINKYIVFHDVYTFGIRNDGTESVGLLPAILNFLIDNKEWNLKYFTTKSNGLIILERRDDKI